MARQFKVTKQSMRRHGTPGEAELRLQARVSELEAELAAAKAERAAAQADARALLWALAAAPTALPQGEQPPARALTDDWPELRENAERLAAAQAAVAQSEERFRLALAHSPVVVFTQDRSLRYTWVYNPHPDFDPVAVLGKTDFDLLPHDDAAHLTAIKRRAMETGAGQRTEARTTIDGRANYYDLAVEPLRDAEGHITGVACVSTDITERKLAERLLEQQAQQLAALHTLSKAILGSSSLVEIADAAARSLVDVTAARRAAVMLFDWENGHRDLLASHGLELELSRDRAPLEQYWLLDENRAGHTALIQDLETYIPANDRRLRDEMLAGGIRSYAGIPLMIGADVIGALVLTSGESGGFPARVLSFARQVADQIAVALHNARLFEQVQSHRRDLKSLSGRLVQLQEAERRALARDTHDTSGQAMTFINLELAMLQRESGLSEKAHARIEELRHAADMVAEDLHRISVNLRPSSLDRYGLVPAIEDSIHTMRKQAGIEVDLRVEGVDERLPEGVETALYRIVQEATTNITRYAAATHASILLKRNEDAIYLEVADNGRGFDVDEALKRGRLGLLGMRERAEMLGGYFEIESTPGAGSRIRAEVPLAGVGSNRNDGELAPVSNPSPVDDAQSTLHEVSRYASEAAELARAKSLSDTLVDLTGGMSRQESAHDLLDFVLARSAEAVGCDYAMAGFREGDHWLVTHGYQLPESAIGQRHADEKVPLAMQLEHTGQILVLNHFPADGPQAGLLRDLGGSAVVGIPLFAGSRFLGTVAYVRTSPGTPFRPSEVEFVQRLAGSLSLALENIQLRQRDQRQRELLEEVFATAPVGLAVIEGSEYRITLANGMYRAITPHPDVDPAGRLYREIWPPEEGFDKGEAWLAGILQSGQPLDVTRHMRVFPDGSQHYFAFHVRRLFWLGVPAALVVLAETTATEQTAEAARQAAAELETVLSAINDGLVVYDAEGQILRLNRAAEAILGYSEQELGSAFVQRAHRLQPRQADGQPYAFADLPAARALRGETVQGSVMALERADGTAWVSASAAPVYGPDGARRGAVSTFTDITPLHRAQQQLEAAHAELVALHTRLAEERNRLRTLLVNIPDEVWFCDAGGNVMAANPAALRGLGFEKPGDAFQPMPEWTELEIRAADGLPRPLEDAPLLRAWRGEKVERQEEIVRNVRTGEWRHRQASGEAIRDASGQTTGAVIVVRDITEQKQAEQEREQAVVALLESEERYRQLFTSMGEGFTLVRMIFDEQGRPWDYELLELNPAALHRIGAQREDLVGKTARQLNANLEAYWVETFGRVAQTGEPERFENYAGYEDRWYELHVFRPGPDLVAALSQDVTDRKRAEAAREEALVELREAYGAATQSEARLRALIAASAQVLYSMSPDWQEMRQLQGGNFLADTLRPNRHWLAEYIHPDDQPRVWEVIQAAIRSGTVFDLEHRVLRADGTLGWTASRAVPVRNDAGEIVEWFGAASDITERKQAEDQLREAERTQSRLSDRLSESQRLARIGSWEWDLQTNEVWWSDETYRIFGVSPAEYVPDFEANGRFIHPEDFETYVQVFDQALRSGEPLDFDVRLISGDGTLKYCNVKAHIVRNDAGQPISILGTVMDMTERKQAEAERARIAAALGESEKRYRDFFESMHTGFGLLRLINDEAGNPYDYLVLDMNPAYERMIRHKREELVGKTAREVYLNIEPPYLEVYSRIAMTGQPENFEAYSPFSQLWWHVSAYSPGAGLVALVLTDITQTKEAQARLQALTDELRVAAETLDQRVQERTAELATLAELRSSEQRFLASIMDNVPAAITYLDERLTYVHCNEAAAREFGLPVEQILGRHLHEIVPGNPELWAAVEGVLKTGEPFRSPVLTVYWENRPESDRVHHYLVAYLPDVDETGRVRGVFAEGQDVTEQIDTRRQLERAQTELQALSRRLVEVQEAERSYVADQLYNRAGQVLAALQMQLSVLEKNRHDQRPEQLGEMKTVLNQTIRDLHDLANQLRPAGLDRVKFTSVLREYCSQFVQAHGMALVFDAGPTEGLQLADEVVTAVFRSVQEALANVVRHARASEVALSLRGTDDWLMITIADDGAGFDPARAHQQGGVGLIAMRERIESVGGRLAIRSGEHGTAVTIQVPVVKGH